jgi:hypothetical protein|tara:strand:+ start:760 stop:936 length:177 start_codon:yes stop_codon:yes gene_type:complete
MENLEEGELYSIEWNDGEFVTNCMFDREHRGFLIFIDESNNKIICRPESILEIKEIEQ